MDKEERVAEIKHQVEELLDEAARVEDDPKEEERFADIRSEVEDLLSEAEGEDDEISSLKERVSSVLG